MNRSHADTAVPLHRRLPASIMPFTPHLPIDDVLPAVAAALETCCIAVLVAPPGAGKTTRVPLVLLEQTWG